MIITSSVRPSALVFVFASFLQWANSGAKRRWGEKGESVEKKCIFLPLPLSPQLPGAPVRGRKVLSKWGNISLSFLTRRWPEFSRKLPTGKRTRETAVLWNITRPLFVLASRLRKIRVCVCAMTIWRDFVAKVSEQVKKSSSKMEFVQQQQRVPSPMLLKSSRLKGGLHRRSHSLPEVNSENEDSQASSHAYQVKKYYIPVS